MKQPLNMQGINEQHEQQIDTCATEEDAQSEILCNLGNFSPNDGSVVQGHEFHYHEKYVVPDQADIEMQDVTSMPSTIASIIKGFFYVFAKLRNFMFLNKGKLH